MKPVCVVLAGGRSSRMGGRPKGLLVLDGVPMLRRVMAAVIPQVDAILISSNDSPMLFKEYGMPVSPDCVPGFQGPLAGLLTGMLWARLYHPHATHLFSAPCDSPYLPADLVTRLANGLAGSSSEIAIARDYERVHPTLGLWPIALAEQLAADLVGLEVRRMRAWLAQFAVQEVDFDAADLRNVNTPEDLAALCSLPSRNLETQSRRSISHAPH